MSEVFAAGDFLDDDFPFVVATLLTGLVIARAADRPLILRRLLILLLWSTLALSFLFI